MKDRVGIGDAGAGGYRREQQAPRRIQDDNETMSSMQEDDAIRPCILQGLHTDSPSRARGDQGAEPEEKDAKVQQ